MRHEHPLDYAPPPDRPRRPFLAAPIWRNWVVAYVLIGGGFAVSSPVIIPWLGYTMMAAGGFVVVAAMWYAWWRSTVRR